MDARYELLNRNIEISYVSALVGLAAVLVAIRLLRVHRLFQKRRGAIYTAGNQKCTGLITFLKADVLYAPLWRLRRAKEAVYLRSSINFGQLPQRLHILCIFVFICVNIFLITWNLPWSEPATTLIPLLRNRLSSVAIANFIPIVVTSTVQNPLISLLHISYDSFNSIHRWIARITILELITHGLCNIVGMGIHQGWNTFRVSLETPFVHFGLAAAITLTIVLILSWKPIRSLAYEVFHYFHIGLLIVAFSFIWMHLRGHYQRYYLLVAAVIWAFARASRLINVLYRSLGLRAQNCTACVELMPAEALRVTLLLPRPWTFRPGQSLYLNIPSISFWASHPFSVAWADERAQLRKDVEIGIKADLINQHPPQQRANQQALYLVIKQRSGMTNSLFRRIEANQGRMEFKAFVEGPHGTTKSLSEYESVLLFAAGVGITHQLSFVKQAISDSALGQATIKRIRLIWVVPTSEAVEWIRPWLQEILSEGKQPNSNVAVQISLFVTRHSGDELKAREHSEFSDVTLARPDVEALVGEEAEQRQGKMFVSVCANGSLADNVRACVRRLLRKRVNIDFHEEGFGW